MPATGCGWDGTSVAKPRKSADCDGRGPSDPTEGDGTYATAYSNFVGKTAKLSAQK